MRIATPIPAGAYVARLGNGARMSVLGLNEDGDAVVLDARGRLGRAIDVPGFVEVTAPDPVAPVVNVSTPAPRAERAAPARREPVAEPAEPENDQPRENPVRAFRRAQGLPWRGEAA